MATYPFVGGPCDGQRSPQYTIRPPVGFTFDCGTHTYVFGADGRFHDAGLAAVFAPGSGEFGVKAPRGWHDLQLAVNQRAPTALAKAQRLRRASLGKVRRALR